MPFDETLRQAFDTLTDRLRDEIAGALNSAAAELAAAAQTDRDLRIAEVEEHAASRLAEAARDADARLIDAVAAAEATARESRHASELAGSERLLAAIRGIDRAASLSEILDALLGAAAREAARAGIFLVRGTTLAGWRFVDATGSASAFESADGLPLTLDLNDASIGVVGEAVRTGGAASSDTAAGFLRPPFELPDGRERVALPIAMSGQVVAVLYADQGVWDDRQRDVAAAWPSILEVLTRHAARSLEALTAFKAARALTERPDAAVPDAASNAAHEAALRYARLLVAEIKLYHEPAIVAGRLERDLGSRLGGEIAHARSMYEQRVPADVRSQADYFGAEIVRTLANGDTTLLGQTT
jgi:hypothetical protein